MQEPIKSVCGLWSLIILGIIENLRQIKVSRVVIGNEVTVTDAMVCVFFKLLSIFSKFYTKQVSKKSKATKQCMIKENKYTSGYRPKFGCDVNNNSYLVHCEKEQSVIRLMNILRKKNKLL